MSASQYANQGVSRAVVLDTKPSPAQYFVQNNLVFSIFILLFVPIFIYIFLAFFGQFSIGLNTFLFGVFKRPLPIQPELYFDVNCINEMSLEDFQDPGQVQRCRTMRPINRIGPPLRFS